MKPHGLVDTGALLALLDRDDEWHQRCVASFERMRLPLATTPAVLTELFHLLDPHEHEAAWMLLGTGAVHTLPIDAEDLPDIQELMTKYGDRPMDFADATLVRLARREEVATVLTVDDDFHIYRIKGRKKFLVEPSR